MRNRNLTTVLLTITFLSVVAFGQAKKNCDISKENILARQVCNDEIKWKDSHIIWILPRIFNSVNVPAGISIEFKKAGQKDELNDFTPESFILRDILNKVSIVQNQYLWKEVNGVVNIYPIKDYSILDIIIKEFSVKDITRGEAIGKILETNEFKQYIKSKNMREADTSFFGGNFSKPVKNISFDLKNATVREILNEIVRKNGNSTWIYREYESENEGEIKTIYYLR